MKSPFLMAVAENMRMKNYAEKTIKAYIYWITSYTYPLPIKMHLSVASSNIKTRRNRMLMTSPYRVLQRCIDF